MFVGAGVAQAHELYIYHGDDKAAVTADHKTISVRDGECDSHFVWAEWTAANGTTGSLTDANGCAGIGNQWSVPVGVSQFRLCEQAVSCTPWRYT